MWQAGHWACATLGCWAVRRAGWGEPLGTDGHSPDTPTHALQFNNLGQRALPISVVFWVPIQLNQVTVWDDPQVTFSQVSPTDRA